MRKRLRRHVDSVGLVILIVAAAYVGGYRMERAVLRIVPEGEAHGEVVVNRLEHTQTPARLALQGSYKVHPRDFSAVVTVYGGSARAEFLVYRGDRVVRRAGAAVEVGQSLRLEGGFLFTSSSTTETTGEL